MSSDRLLLLEWFNIYGPSSWNSHAAPPYIRPEVIEACQLGYDAAISPNPWEMIGRDPITQNKEEDYIDDSHKVAETLIDAGIDVWLELTDPICYQSNDFHINTTFYIPNEYMAHTTSSAEDFEDLYGDYLDYYESLGSHFKGYIYEACFDAEAAWLWGRTDRTIMFEPFEGTWGWYSVNHDSLDTRLSQCNEVSVQFFYVSALANLTPLILHIQENYPNMPIGCTMGYGYHPLEVWWSEDINYKVEVPAEAQKNRCITGTTQAKDIVGTFDFIAPFVWKFEDYIAETPGMDTLVEQCQFYKALNLTEPATKYTWDMPQYGLRPYYSGASMCTHETMKPPDTFANTGNELLLLKNVGACGLHDITITSTDALTYEDYKIALNPDRGTFIGPFPTALFGALPTITYDNTNLYISILQDVPS